MLFRSDRKSTRLNSSHTIISYAVFCLKKKTNAPAPHPPTTPNQARPPAPHRAAHSPRVARGVRLGCALGVRLRPCGGLFFFFNDTATTEIYTLSLHDALPICAQPRCGDGSGRRRPVLRFRNTG